MASDFHHASAYEESNGRPPNKVNKGILLQPHHYSHHWNTEYKRNKKRPSPPRILRELTNIYQLNEILFNFMAMIKSSHFVFLRGQFSRVSQTLNGINFGFFDQITSMTEIMSLGPMILGANSTVAIDVANDTWHDSTP